MPSATHSILRLHAEAARCERLAMGVSDPELVARLTAWASEYRRDAEHLAWAESGVRLAA